MTPLSVVCLYVKGPYRYSADYVVRLERMVRRHLSRPFTFTCLVDRETLPEVLAAYVGAREFVPVLVQVESLAGLVPDNGVGYWNKLRLFDPAMGFGGRVLYLDLDTWVVSSLDPIADYPASLALTADAFVVERAHLNTDRDGRRLVRRFNSSVMVWDAGTHSDLWRRWTPTIAQQLSTDQDWIGEQAEDALGMPLEWFPRISHLTRDAGFAATGTPLPGAAKVVLTKKPKNHICAEQWPWFDQAWGGPA